MGRRTGFLGVALALWLFAGAAHAADPAATRVSAFCKGLIEAVRQSAGQGAQARVRRLEPLVEEAFNMKVMAQFAVGPPWTAMTAAEQANVTAALTRYGAGRFADEFDRFSGQTCVVDPLVQTRGPDTLVKSKILQPGQEPAALNFRLRDYGGAPKIVDVYYNGVSQLATERADFAGVLRTGGAAALASRLNELTAKLR